MKNIIFGQYESDWKKVVDNFSPDIVHIHGTEYSHGMKLMNVCPELKYVVSIQGLVSVIHRHFLAGMSMWDVIRNITFRDIVRLNTLFHARRDFYKRGLIEKKYIQQATAVIGRTEWDRAHTWAINPTVSYHFCNESLRDEFYTNEKWSLENCRQYSIFLSQASYPIKGLHQVLKAIALLKADYPEILIEVAGHDITKSTTFKERLKRGGYGRYIASLIKIYGLQNNIKFLDSLSAKEMKEAYLRAHVFICSSSIENSPNSIGEAQMLRVPCIASYIGGIPSMAKDGESLVFYPFDDINLLAYKIKMVFSSKDLSCKLSRVGFDIANERHSRKKNNSRQLSIYKEIINLN